MVEDYASPILALVRKTANNRKGITQVVNAAAKAVEQVDIEVSDLLNQRSEMQEVIRHFMSLYEILLGEDMRTKEGITIPETPPQVSELSTARDAVLKAADKLGAGGLVNDNAILTLLVHIPWRNPKAVIATILTRSGKWRRKEKGVFERITDAD